MDTFIPIGKEFFIHLTDGRIVTAVCADAKPDTARLVVKTVLGEYEINDNSWDNSTGYFKSKMCLHVSRDILLLFPQEWRDIMKPRHLKEKISGETIEYNVLLWLLSATDVFGWSDTNSNLFWEDIDDSYQLPLFEDKEKRIFTWGEKPCMIWLRSVCQGGLRSFWKISTDGTSDLGGVFLQNGVLVGFDI